MESSILSRSSWYDASRPRPFTHVLCKKQQQGEVTARRRVISSGVGQLDYGIFPSVTRPPWWTRAFRTPSRSSVLGPVRRNDKWKSSKRCKLMYLGRWLRNTCSVEDPVQLNHLNVAEDSVQDAFFFVKIHIFRRAANCEWIKRAGLFKNYFWYWIVRIVDAKHVARKSKFFAFSFMTQTCMSECKNKYEAELLLVAYDGMNANSFLLRS